MKVRTLSMSLLGAMAALGLVLSVAQAADKPDATLELSGGSVAAGVGYSWGEGTLKYMGKTYQIEVSGLSAGDVGASKIEATGDVFHLSKLADFDGSYTAGTAEATVGGGASATIMKNQNGVTIKLISTTQGLKFTFGPSGVSLKIKK